MTEQKKYNLMEDLKEGARQDVRQYKTNPAYAGVKTVLAVALLAYAGKSCMATPVESTDTTQKDDQEISTVVDEALTAVPTPKPAATPKPKATAKPAPTKVEYVPPTPTPVPPTPVPIKAPVEEEYKEIEQGDIPL
ncbi:hypothetical protein ACFLZ7_00455 [Nanoarchaeota archaeon]